MADHALAAAGLAVPPVREEEVGAARRAEVEPLDGGATGLAQRPLGRAPQVEPTRAGDVASEAGLERRRHVLPHLVAAGPDRRPDRSRDRVPTERRDSRLDDAGEETAPARME